MAVWIVLLEADVGPGAVIEDDVVRRLLAGMGEHSLGLHCQDRCAVQLEIAAANQADALRTALSRWHEVVSRSELRGWDLVRTEVLTREELAREIRAQDEAADPAPDTEDDGPGPAEAYGDDLLARLFSDPLTGLPTREVFWSRLERALATARDGEVNAVACLKVDGVRGSDGRLRGTAAEQVVVAVAQRLVGSVRAHDFVAHLGTDSFGILIENSSERAASAIVERLVDGARAAVSVPRHEVVPTVRAGVVLAERGDTPDAVLGYADMALSPAQSSDRGGVELFRSGERWLASERLDSRVTQTHDRLGYLLLMQEVTVATNEAVTLEEAAEVVLHQVCARTGWLVGRLCLAAHDAPEQLLPPSVWHLPTLDRYQGLPAATQKAAVPSALSVAREVLVSGRPGYLADLDRAPERPAADALLGAGLRGAFAAPVLVGREVVAVLEFFTDEPIEPEASLVEVIAAVGIQLGRVVERTRAREVLQDWAASTKGSTPGERARPDRNVG
ncbi:MAG TPA: diguanylate cyclase [Acidimicrobiales bacterium]|nr:diguanylate cyclase [Acidimicrobiales bacterium]